MAIIRDIKGRIKSIRNIQQITHAMTLVAAAKMHKAEIAILNARPYARRLKEVLTSLAIHTEDSEHPLLKERPIQNMVIIIITTERGLCGGFNSNLIRSTQNYLKEQHIPIKLITIGNKGNRFFKKLKYPILTHYPMSDKVPYSLACEIGKRIINGYLELEFDEVYFIYNEFKSVLQQQIIIEKLLPIKPVEPPSSKAIVDYIYEPSQKEILDTFLSKHIFVQIHRMFMESESAGHAARMVAMETATSNSKRLLNELTFAFNKIRQATITKEIAELVGSAEAIGKER